MEDEPELPPAVPPHDVSQSLHYEPVLDPESEFSWHRSDNRLVEKLPESNIDMTDVHDPWEIYRGNIPPKSEKQPVQHASEENLEEMRKYAWNYQHQEHSSAQTDYKKHHKENYWPPQSTHQHEHYNHEYHNESRQEYNQSPRQSEQQRSNTLPQTDYIHSMQSSHSYHDQSNDHRDHWHSEGQDISHNNHQHHHEDHHQQSSHLYNNHHLDKELKSSSYIEPEMQYHPGNESQKHHDYQGHSYQVQQQHAHYLHLDTHTHTHEVEVRHVHVVSEKKRHRRRRPRRLRIDIVANGTNGLMNGDISETESESFDEIIPRHPYDGFYLRHRATIDARGRKICTHEIPPTPSPTPSPPDSPTPQEYLTAEDEPSDDENQVSLCSELQKQYPKVIFVSIRSYA